MSSLLLFALIAVALVGVALAFVLPALLRTRGRGDDVSPAALNAQMYARQVDELRQEVEHGDLAEADARHTRAELRRRLLEDTRVAPTVASRPGRARRAAAVVAIALPLVAVVLYLAVGQPGSLTEERAVPEAEAVGGEDDDLARLQAHLARQPRDARTWARLARAYAERSAFEPAAEAFERALSLSATMADDPAVLCDYANALAMAQGGSFAGRPTELIERALEVDPKHPVALDMAGSAAYAQGRFADAARHWKTLLAGLAPGSERHQQLAAAVAQAERRAEAALPR